MPKESQPREENILDRKIQNSASLNLPNASEKTGFDEKSTGFCIRIDIGTGFNMRITSVGTDSLNQFTTIKSETPRLEKYRMADRSFSLTQRTMLPIEFQTNKSPKKIMELQRYDTPQSPKTPQLSHGSHGWTLLPHGRVNSISLFNESPKEMEEEYVNNMTLSPIRRVKSIRTYEESQPPVTISKDRRHYGVSPRSVYKNQYLNRRNLFGEGYKNVGFALGSDQRYCVDDYVFHGNENSIERSDRLLSWDAPDVLETDVPYSSSESTPAEELNWSGLFSPENSDTQVKPSQRPGQPPGGFVSQPGKTMRYFQPSNGFIPSTF